MKDVELTFTEAVDGSLEYRLSISKKSFMLINLDIVERQQLMIHDENCIISDTLWEIGNIVRRIERQLNRTMLQNGGNDEPQPVYEYPNNIDNFFETVNVFDKKDNVDPG